MKLFGREPAVWVAFIEATIALVLALRWVHWTSDQTALVMAVVVAVFGVVTAYLTKDTMLGVLVGLTKALLALFIGFGLMLSPELTAAVIGFVVVVVGLFQRTQTSPAPQPSFHG